MKYAQTFIVTNLYCDHLMKSMLHIIMLKVCNLDLLRIECYAQLKDFKKKTNSIIYYVYYASEDNPQCNMGNVS